MLFAVFVVGFTDPWEARVASLPDRPTREELRAFIAESNLQYATVAFVDFQGTVRGKYVARSSLEALLEHVSLPLTALAFDPTDAILFAPGIADLHSSFSDKPAMLLPETARLIPWEREGRNLFLLAEFTGEGAKYCPRNVYHRVAQRAEALGCIPCHAVEFEFTLFDETPASIVEKAYRHLKPATPGRTYLSLLRQGAQSEFYNELMDMCTSMRIPISSLHEEMGGGFMEAALRHSRGVEAADQAALFRTFAKVVAQRRGMLMTFMARWSNEAHGQSGHLHISLHNRDGKALFHDAGAPNGMSKTMLRAIGGMQHLMGDFLLMFAPNVNSYKRLLPGNFAPISAAWGIENRTCGIRVIPGTPESMRIEFRVPGADANPYLSLAAVVAAALYGIEHEMEPSAPFSANAYETNVPAAMQLPSSLGEAICRFRQSVQAREFFGDTFVSAYADTRATQLAQFNSLVSDRELERFFEQV
jgi:glutamine synthetase